MRSGSFCVASGAIPSTFSGERIGSLHFGAVVTTFAAFFDTLCKSHFLQRNLASHMQKAPDAAINMPYKVLVSKIERSSVIGI
jgi:hypothetical protein